MNDESSLPSDKVNRIAEAVESLERNVTALRQKQSISRSAYMNAGNQDLRDSVERKFEKLAEAMLDIADQVLKHERGASPNGRNETKRFVRYIERAFSMRNSRRTYSMRSASKKCSRIRMAR
jgi:hypothetical protein